jgi:alpha-beta hydrolase superfamily lysophospholipase
VILRILSLLGVLAGGLYATFLVGGFLLRDTLIFHPPAASYEKDAYVRTLTARDGTELALYAHPAENPEAPSILYFHGNAEDTGYLRFLFENIAARGYGVYALDYRGYGLSQGRPTTENICEDAHAAWNYLVEEEGVAPSRIVLYGRSIGTGPALALAREYAPGGVILEGAFLSVFRALTQIRLHPRDPLPNLKNIPHLSSPLLVIHGTRDGVVPFWQGKKLFEAARVPKEYYWVRGAGHNNLLYVAKDEYYKRIDTFLQGLSRESSEGSPQGSTE